MSFESLHLALLLVLVFMTVANGTPPQLFDFSMTIGIGLLCSGPIAFCTQAFFIFRLYAFSHKKALSAFCSILVITQFLFTLMGSIATTSFKPQLLDRWRWFTISTLIITICADTAIAVSMRFYLKATESGIHRTSRVIDRMVVYIIATGTITSIFALASGVAFIVSSTTYLWLALFMIESGLYTNSLLAALNARAKFSHELQHPGSAAGLEVSLSRFGVRQLHT